MLPAAPLNSKKRFFSVAKIGSRGFCQSTPAAGSGRIRQNPWQNTGRQNVLILPAALVFATGYPATLVFPSACLLCDQRALGDERHMVFECPALQGVRDKYAALFVAVDGASTMQQFMWQQNVIGVAHFVKDCIDLLDAPV